MKENDTIAKDLYTDIPLILKTETEAIHKQVEKTNLARFIMDRSITEEQYLKHLADNYFAYKSIEEHLYKNKNTFPESFQVYVSKAKSNALKNDIESRIKKPLDYKIIRGYDTVAELIGMLYVIEGSMLGGMMIGKQLDRCAHLKAWHQHHFYQSDAKTKMEHWKNFKNQLSTLSFNPQEKTKMIEAASYAFSLFDSSTR